MATLLDTLDYYMEKASIDHDNSPLFKHDLENYQTNITINTINDFNKNATEVARDFGNLYNKYKNASDSVGNDTIIFLNKMKAQTDALVKEAKNLGLAFKDGTMSCKNGTAMCLKSNNNESDYYSNLINSLKVFSLKASELNINLADPNATVIGSFKNSGKFNNKNDTNNINFKSFESQAIDETTYNQYFVGNVSSVYKKIFDTSRYVYEAITGSLRNVEQYKTLYAKPLYTTPLNNDTTPVK